MENIFETLAEITKPETLLLSHLESKARRAHYWTSFSPEKRGLQMVADYFNSISR